MVSCQDLGEAPDGLLQTDKLSGSSGENLCDVERLRHEALHLPRPSNGHLVVLAKLVHTKDGNDVLQGLVVLQQLLGVTGKEVVVVSNHAGVEHATGGVEGIDGRVNSKLGNGTGQHGGGVQVRKGGSGGRIGKIIGGHVHGLHGGDGSLLGGGNALLEPSHVGSKGGLVSDGGRDAAEKGRHLGTGLGESENVVNEEEHVLALRSIERAKV